MSRQMPGTDEEILFNESYCARVKSARLGRSFTAEQMAVALGIPADRYRKYESRSVLPPYLLERFCLVAGVSLEWLVTGKGRAPNIALQEVTETNRKQK